jgi:Resolvase, N terminal domain
LELSFDAVAVFRFDRFAPAVSHLARALEESRALGIEFVSLREAIDKSTPIGRAMFHVAGAFGEPFGARRAAHAEVQPLAMISVRREPGPLAKPKVLLSPAVRARR